MLQHGESNAKLYRAASELIDEIEELEDLRHGLISNTSASLDSEIARMQ